MLQEDRGGAAGWWKRPAEAWGPGQRLLACGAQVIAELRAAVREELGYSCSAGAPQAALAWACSGPAACTPAEAHAERRVLVGMPSQHALTRIVVPDCASQSDKNLEGLSELLPCHTEWNTAQYSGITGVQCYSVNICCLRVAC